MNRLIYVGSPQFDGIGLLNIEAQRMLKNGTLTILDGIVPGAYPEIKNFSRADHLIWTWIRKDQFLEVLQAGPIGRLRYVRVTDLLGSSPSEENLVVHELLEDAIRDHCVCNNLTGPDAKAYRDRHWRHQYAFLCSAYEALQALFRQDRFAQVTLFNGRNTLARLLVDVAKEYAVPVSWLEYFGKRNNRMTYIASPVDIFDFDAMSDYILNSYRANSSPERDSIADECLSDRIKNGDPILAKWGVDFSAVCSADSLGIQSPAVRGKKKSVAFFFSSEDEYPAVKPSAYGFSPPTEQYRAFLQICEEIVAVGLHYEYRILVKLHPRYAVERAKLSHAQSQWDQAIVGARRLGVDFELVEPLTSAYSVIAQADIVFSYGSTAWEATYMGKPAVLMGPNLFSTHDCAHIARSVDDVISFLKHIPEPKPVEHCYPYAWAWREMGQDAPDFKVNSRGIMLKKIKNGFFNRFSHINHAK